MEVKGAVHFIGETENFGQNGFTKRLLVVKDNSQYPQLIPIDFVKDKTALLDGLNIGQEVTVQINLRGSESNGKWYLNAQGWKVE